MSLNSLVTNKTQHRIPTPARVTCFHYKTCMTYIGLHNNDKLDLHSKIGN